jgi:hypothetical protein
MQKAGLGISAVVLLGIAIALLVVQSKDANVQAFQAACLRVAIVLGAWWLAYDELRRLPKWILFVIPAAILLAALNKRWMPLVVVILVVAVLAKLGQLTKRR